MDNLTKLASSYCAPHRMKRYERDGSCMTYEEMLLIGRLYNKNNKNDKIPWSVLRSKEQLKQELSKRLSECKGHDEYCWIQHPVVSSDQNVNQQLKNSFRPLKPKSWSANSREWLNTYDIMRVMKQYELQHKHFKFIGVFPMDFAKPITHNECVSKELCKFNVASLLKAGKTDFGIVFNTDYHDEPGEHWVAVYCSLDFTNKKFGICYYDSGSDPIKDEIRQLFITVKTQVRNLYGDKASKSFRTKYNNVQHQFKNTECGMFSMFFIIACLENKQMTYHQIRQNIGHDDDINKFRDVFYTPNVTINIK